MRKTVALFLFLLPWGWLLIPAASHAQLGFKGGVNISAYAPGPTSDVTSGITAGFYHNFDVPLSPFSIQAEALYASKGARPLRTGPAATEQLTYIEVPVLAKYDLGSGRTITPNVQVGPYAAYNIRAQLRWTSTDGMGNPVSRSSDIKDRIRAIDYGFVIGAGVYLNFLSIDLRYAVGIRDIYRRNSTARNRSLSVIASLGL